MTDDKISTDDLHIGDTPKAARPAEREPDANPTPPAAPKPKAARKPRAAKPAGPVDNAVSENDVHWECACGNTNTHSLTYCGKCNAPRYS